MKCPNCGANLSHDGKPCLYCGTHQAAQPQPAAQQGPSSPQQAESAAPFLRYEAGHYGVYSDKNKWITLLLCFFFGYSGAHKFYVGRVVGGIVYLLTFGLFGFGWLIDLVTILFGRFRDQHGRRIVGGSAFARRPDRYWF